MEHAQISAVARRFKQIFAEPVMNALGKTTRFCQRVREITPYRLALGLTEFTSTMRVETIADAHGAFNAQARPENRLQLGLEHVYGAPKN